MSLMIRCSRIVANATTDDDLPPPGSALAEALQLARDPANIKRLVEHAVKKFSSSKVIVRVKALRFLNHLVQNGPAAVLAEIRLNTTAISDCMSFRGPPHPTRGYEPYEEMKDAAQTLLDLSFSAVTSAPIASFGSPTSSHPSAAPPVRIIGYSNMESCGNREPPTQAAPLEPRNLDPNHRDLVGDVAGFFKRAFSRDDTPAAYPAVPNVPGTSQATTGVLDLTSPAIGTPPPPRGQMDRLQADVNWSKKKPSQPIVEPPKAATDTPAGKLLRVTGNRALPTNGELNAFKVALTADAFSELEVGLVDTDWKVKLRAVAGLECFGEKFGWGPVAHFKAEFEKMKAAPQASLRTAAARVAEKVQGVEPTAPPSAFDLAGEEHRDENEEAGFDFA